MGMEKRTAFVDSGERERESNHFASGVRAEDLAAGLLRDDEDRCGHEDAFAPGDAFQAEALVVFGDRAAVADFDGSEAHRGCSTRSIGLPFADEAYRRGRLRDASLRSPSIGSGA